MSEPSAVIFVGRKADADAISAAIELTFGGKPTSPPDLITHGTLDAEAIDRWVYLEPVAGRITLKAPAPNEGDVPGEWIDLGADDDGIQHYTNTSDLVAVRVEANA